MRRAANYGIKHNWAQWNMFSYTYYIGLTQTNARRELEWPVLDQLFFLLSASSHRQPCWCNRDDSQDSTTRRENLFKSFKFRRYAVQSVSLNLIKSREDQITSELLFQAHPWPRLINHCDRMKRKSGGLSWTLPVTFSMFLQNLLEFLNIS